MNSPINHVSKMYNYLLIHTVLQMTLSELYGDGKLLVKSNIEFDFFAYPNKNHGIYGGIQDFICIIKMTKFLKDNLLE